MSDDNTSAARPRRAGNAAVDATRAAGRGRRRRRRRRVRPEAGRARAARPAGLVGGLAGPSARLERDPTRGEGAYARSSRGSPPTRDQGQGQHGRPQHVPEPDQLVPAGPARRTSSRGSPATACSSSPRRTWPPPIDDVWKALKPQTSRPSIQAASKGLDGHYYFVPIYNYPWAVFYRKSVFDGQGLQGSEDLGRSSSRWPRR